MSTSGRRESDIAADESKASLSHNQRKDKHEQIIVELEYWSATRRERSVAQGNTDGGCGVEHKVTRS